MDFIIQICFAITGGVLPALIWLYFWLKEDDQHPEPNKLILLTFFSGMLAVPFALVLQIVANRLIPAASSVETLFFTNTLTAILVLTVWATAEEFVKYLAGYFGGISRKENDEPLDPIIYMITAALGFAALENTMFLIHPIFQGDTTTALITGNMRFIGATLLHVASSALIGIFIALSYYKSQKIKSRYFFIGFILSVILHVIFNSFIIKSGAFTLIGFATVWLSIITILIIFERVKVKINNKVQNI